LDPALVAVMAVLVKWSVSRNYGHGTIHGSHQTL
jgi:hypothetical protein